MKYGKALIAIILLLNVPLFAFAQNGKKWNILVHGDIALTNMTGRSSSYNSGIYFNAIGPYLRFYNVGNYGGKSLRIGWDGGTEIQYAYTNHILLETGINYSVKGGMEELSWGELWDYDNEPLLIKGTIPFRLSYLTVPITIGYKFNGIKHFYPSAGLYYGYLLTAFAQGEYNGMGEAQHYKEDIMKDYLRNDVGYCVRLNYVIPLKKLNHFIIDLKYSHSLFSIGSTKINPRPDVYNQMFSLGLSYEFTL